MDLLEDKLADDINSVDARRFEFSIIRLANALDPGLDSSQFVGQGIDYVQSRPWAEGDDVRAIDHRVSARSDRIFVKEYESMRGMPVLLALDATTSMQIGLARRSKYRVACAICAGIGLAAIRRGSSAAIECCSSSPLRQPSTRSRGALLASLRRLPALAASNTEAEAGLADFLGSLPARMKQRHLVVVLSDLHGQGVIPALRRLHIEHDCMVIRPVDPVERQAPRGGLILASEAETSQQGLRRGLPRIDVDGPIEALRGAGIDVCELPLDRPWLSLLHRFLRLRGSARTAAR